MWLETVEGKPGAVFKINSDITLDFPIWKTFLTMPALSCQAHLHSNSHLFLLSVALQPIIPKFSGLKQQWFIIFHASVDFESGQGSSGWFFCCMWCWLTSFTQLPSWLPRLGSNVQGASLTFLGTSVLLPVTLSV